MEANIEWIIVLAVALALLNGVTYELHKDVKELKKLKKEVKYNSTFRYSEGVGRYTLFCRKLKEAGIRSRVIYYEDGTVHISGDPDAVKALGNSLNLTWREHYYTNDFLPVRKGVPIKYTHSVLGGF